MSNKKVKLAMAFYSLCQCQILVIDRLERTSLYKRLIKNLCNKLSKECQKEIDTLYQSFDNDEVQKQFSKTVEMIEIFVNVVENKDIEVFISLLKEFENGNVSVIDENKHQKILSQLDKI